MFLFDFLFENNDIHNSRTMALEKLDLVKNGNEICYLAHTFDANGNKSHLWMTEEIAAGCVVILRRYATVMWTASKEIVLWGTNSLGEKTYVPRSVRNELERVSFFPKVGDKSGLNLNPEGMEGN